MHMSGNVYLWECYILNILQNYRKYNNAGCTVAIFVKQDVIIKVIVSALGRDSCFHKDQHPINTLTHI